MVLNKLYGACVTGSYATDRGKAEKVKDDRPNKKKKKKSIKKFQVPSWATKPVSSVAASACLKVSKSGKHIKDIDISKKKFYVIGRNETHSDIVLHHATISRQQIAIVYDGTSFWAFELGSTSGSWVKDPKKSETKLSLDLPCPLVVGSTFRFGESKRKYMLYYETSTNDETSNSIGRSSEKLPQSFKSYQNLVNEVDEHENANSGSLHDKHRINSNSMNIYKKNITGEESEKIENTCNNSTKPNDSRASRLAAIAECTKSLMGPIPSHSRYIPPPIVEEEEETEESKRLSYLHEQQQSVIEQMQLPVTHALYMRAHSKYVSTITIDSKGTRMVSGSFDNLIKLWDFNGMNETRLDPFRSIESQENCPVIAASYSPTGGQFIAVTGSMQPGVFDRDGVLKMKLRFGDTALFDKTKTAGHVSSCSGGMWHPLDRSKFATCSMDCTVRFWDVEGRKRFGELLNSQVAVARNRHGKPVPVCATSYRPDSKGFAIGCNDGSLQIFKCKSKITRPELCVREAHKVTDDGHVITNISWGNDGRRIATRGSDATLKLWDVRRLTTPVSTWTNLPSESLTTGCCFSPDGMLLCTAVSSKIMNPNNNRVKKGKKFMSSGHKSSGSLEIFDAQSSKQTPLHSIPMAPGEGAVSVNWHSTLNQIFVGCTSGRILALYSDKYSTKGIRQAAIRKGKKRTMDVYSNVGDGYHIMSREKGGREEATLLQHKNPARRRAEQDAKRQKMVALPHIPACGPLLPTFVHRHHNFTEFVVASRSGDKLDIHADPRAELLRQQAKIEEERKKLPEGALDKESFLNAWNVTQPKVLLHKKTAEQEKIDMEKVEEE